MAIALSGSLVITGSIFATQGITGSFSGSATSASYADTLQGLGSASFAPAATFNTVSQSFATTSGSLSTRVTNLESTSSTVSSSFATTSGSIAGRVTLIEGQYATTGSNTFTGPQYVSQASNAISFTSTASLYTDGGLRVSKDSFVSGTAYFNNVVVYGTSSIQYITSSQVNFGTNIITVNTDTPAVRFGGLAVFDSGSTQLTGSMLWDSEKNHWIYSNPSGSTYNSAMLMNGPRNTGSLGNEQGTTSCYLMAGQGGDHITSSQIYHDSTITCIGNSKIAGNFNVAGNSCLGGGSFYASTDSTFLTDKSYTFRDAVGITNPNGLSYCSAATTVISVGSMSNGNSIITTGNVGIGTACPTVPLQALGTIATGADTSGWGRFSFDTNVVKIQASKDGIDPIGISFWTQASGGAFAERMRIACDGKVGIGTTSPSAELQVNKNCDAVIAISSCVGVTTGNRGALAFYNCATSTVAIIRAAAITDNVGTELQFHTRPAAGSLTQVMTLQSTGVACFSSTLCANYLYSVTNVVANDTLFTGGSIRKLNDNQCIFFKNAAGNNEMILSGNGSLLIGTAANHYCAALQVACKIFFPSTSGVDYGGTIYGWNDTSRFPGEGGLKFQYFNYDGAAYAMRDGMVLSGIGTACFANTVCTPTIVSNNSTGFAACITSCSTDYSMYIRNMSSGFPLSVYTVGDSNGVNDDLKAIKIARSSNDNQFLALSLIYGGFGYGYKLAPRYYNGAAYVCGNPTVIDGYGNVGINCTAPYMPLTVAGCAGIDRLAINCTGFNSFGEHLQVRGCARFFAGQLRISNAGADGNYMFLTHDDTNGYLCICRTVYAGNLILAPFGGVGINTSVVSSKLSVNSGISVSSANVLTLQQATNGAVKDAVAFGVSINNGGESTNAADLYISTATGGALCERMRITSGGVICFNNTVCAPVVQQPTGFTVYSFPIDYGASYTDISSGNYLSIGGTEPGTMNSYCAYAHGGISPRAVASNTEGMSWTCLRFVLRVGSPVGDQSTTPTYLQTAGYFYTVGFYGICTCTNIVSAMDGSRGYSTVVLPWIPFSAFTGAGDVTGFGIRNVGPTTTRIGSVWIQYK